jgi:beta-N-acetylhexosaminidase
MPLDVLKKTVGSLLVVGFDGYRVTDSLENFLKQWDLGGVILFKRNIESFEQVRELNGEIDRLSAVAPILSVDHEGGRVFRLPEPFTAFPPMRQVGEACLREGTAAPAEEVGRIFARELRAAGFNLDYAPVLDVDSNSANPIIGDRAFSSDPEAAAETALAFWRGLEAEGVRGCGKHFPGHGETAEDSHLTLPTVDKPEKDLVLCEWVPFVKAIRAGVPMIMTAHVLYPALDKDWPATLSEKILQGLLRKRMGFQGLIISDDFFMEGIAARWGMEEAVERFLLVGGDLVLLCHQEAVQRRVAAHLVHRAEKDSGFRVLLEEKAKKVLNFREKLERRIGTTGLALPVEAHQAFARRFLPA